MFPMIYESCLCLEEKIVETPMELDLALIYGLGFPPFRGGIMKYCDSLGLSNILDRFKKYEDLGGCYQKPNIMTKMVSQKKSFYQN